MKICVVIANYYPKISKDLLIGTSNVLKKEGIKYMVQIGAFRSRKIKHFLV